VTTTFKQQSALKVALPESSQSQKPGASENLPFEVNIDTNGIYYIGKPSLPVTLEQLQDKLKSEASKNPNLVLEIRADEKSPWGKIVKIRDIAAEAKIKTLRAATKEPSRP